MGLCVIRLTLTSQPPNRHRTFRDQDAHLFTPQELQHMHAMSGLPHPALSLLLRLALRRGTWFAVQELQYSEVCEYEVQ